MWPVPAPGLSFRVGDATVELGSDGTVVGLRHDIDPGTNLLAAAGEVRVNLAGETLAWSAPRIGVDADEVEIALEHAGVLSATVRHTFATSWGVRLVLANLADEPLAVDEAALGWAPAEGVAGWALAAEAVGAYAVFPPGRDGPLLGGVLALGAFVRVSSSEISLGPLRLPVGGRYAVQWQWSWFDHARAFLHRSTGQGDRQVPRTQHLFEGEVAMVTAGADEALVLDPGLAADPAGYQLELSAGPGRYGVELRWPRGVTRYDLTWVESTEVLLTDAATKALAGVRTPAGVVRLTGVDEALVLQLALRAGLDDTESAEEALDLFTVRLDAAAETDPRTASFLCGEFDRTGDVEALEAASAIVLAAGAVLPGLGFAAAQVGLARVLAGLPLTELTRQLAEVGAALAEPGSGALAAQIAVLELVVSTRQASAAADVSARLAALGPWLGAGLKGTAVRPLPLPETAHLAAVLAGLSEQTSTGLRSTWAATGHEVGLWTEAGVIARLDRTRIGPAHSWLAAAARTR